MENKNKLQEIRNLDCLNCGYPFLRNEVYCSECGQKNKGSKITLGSFANEMFKGFTSWDAKFWKTLFPLITKPGKVSKDYIEGKRTRYTNPFRFYLTTSVVFFLLLGLISGIESYQEFTSGKVKNKDLGIIKVNKGSKEESNEIKDTITHAKIAGKDISKFVDFQRKHPNLSIQQALDSLQLPNTFFNKFLYKKSATINGFSKDPDRSVNKLIQEARSHVSTAIFILLPIFALFLKLLYIRRKYTYIEHLIFVFHTQTVLFLLLIVFSLLGVFFSNTESLIPTYLFVALFLTYLLIAIKVFYKQRYFKTVIKFLLIITTYTFLVFLGTGVVMVVAFALM